MVKFEVLYSRHRPLIHLNFFWDFLVGLLVLKKFLVLVQKFTNLLRNKIDQFLIILMLLVHIRNIVSENLGLQMVSMFLTNMNSSNHGLVTFRSIFFLMVFGEKLENRADLSERYLIESTQSYILCLPITWMWHRSEMKTLTHDVVGFDCSPKF